MAAELDHLILHVNDVAKSLEFYTEILGFRDAGEQPPFRVLRVHEGLTLQLAPWGTSGGTHLAFALPQDDFETIFARVRERGVPFGDSFHSVGNQKGPGEEAGARGPGKAVYVLDPNQHLIEIRHY